MDKKIIDELKHITRNRNDWKFHIDDVAAKLDEKYGEDVNAKALWLLGEMGLKHPEKIESYVNDIAFFMDSENPKLRQRSLNAIGRIGRADISLVSSHMDALMSLKNDESGEVRHAFIWACENIASSAPEIFCDKLDIFYEMIFDDFEKVRIEAPEMFRVIAKTKPECVEPYLGKLEDIAKNNSHRVVRIHSKGAIRMTKKTMHKRG